MGNCLSGDNGGKSVDRGLSFPPDAPVPNEAVDAFLESSGQPAISSKIELSLSASNLLGTDVFSKIDPMAVIYTVGNDGSLQELGRTEVVINSLNPEWITKQIVAYHFEMIQNLLFRVYNVDAEFHGPQVKTLNVDKQQFLGEGRCTLSEIVTKSKRLFTIDLVDGVGRPINNGHLIVHSEEVIVSKTKTELSLRCLDLKNKGSFLVISKYVEGGTNVQICETEVQKNGPSLVWKPLILNTSEVGSKDTPLTIECFNFNNNGNHDPLCKIQKSLAELEKLSFSAQGVHMLSPHDNDHQKKVLKSRLFVDKFSETVHHTFLDYLAGGCELNFMVAIDFTSSNGNPNQLDSLHHIDNSGCPNAYQKAIQEVGEVLYFYDYDKKIPLWGFGARLSDGMVSHCFNLNGTDQSEVDGIKGIMTAYRQAVTNVSLAGPTIFGPVINAAATIASHSLAANQKKYFVLLIITDGVITDLHETINAIVKASNLPLSILIVGVGEADFKEMEILDADDDKRLKSTNGRFASRDIVQFVPFRDVVQGGKVSVVQSLLAELPSQFLAYMKHQGILP